MNKLMNLPATLRLRISVGLATVALLAIARSFWAHAIIVFHDGSKHSAKHTRRFARLAAKTIFLFIASLILCDLAASDAVGQYSQCVEAFKQCSACQQQSAQSRSATGISADSNGKCLVTEYGRKATDPGASESLKACQRCLDATITTGVLRITLSTFWGTGPESNVFTQGDDIRVSGGVERNGQNVAGAKIRLNFKNPKGKSAVGSPAELTTNQYGSFEWMGFLTADALVGTWVMEATVEAAAGTNPPTARRELTVKKLELTDAQINNNIWTIGQMWMKDPSVPNGVDQPFIAALKTDRNLLERGVGMGSGLGPAVNFRSLKDSKFDPYTCGSFAFKTLKFLNGIRFDPNDAERRKLMGGVDYGPVFDGFGYIHIAVAIYRRGINERISDWRSGKILEPWWRQNKEVWGAPSWQIVFGGGTEARYRPTVSGQGNVWEGQYPTSGSDGGYYPEKAELPNRPRGTGVLTYSPVEDLITDSQGRRIGRLPDGTFVKEIPGADHARAVLEDGTFLNLFELPDGQYQVAVIGTGNGVFHLRTTSTTETMSYGEQPITAGQRVTFTLNSANLRQPLMLADGRQVLPQPVGPEGSSAGGATGVGLTGPIAIQTANGNLLTAVRGGGIQGPGAIHTDAIRTSDWETFELVPLPDGKYAIKAVNGNYLTAMRGGGVTGADVIHTDGRRIDAWEKFTLERQADGTYAIRTINGNYVTAVNGGGIGGGRPAIHTNATTVGAWEKFRLVGIGPASGPEPIVPSYPVDWGASPAPYRGQNVRLIFNCPPSGDPNIGTIHGTDLYTDTSPPCKAAVHAGLITFANGGRVTIEMRPGAPSYKGSTRNGVSTRDYEAWLGSFVFVTSQPDTSETASGDAKVGVSFDDASRSSSVLGRWTGRWTNSRREAGTSAITITESAGGVIRGDEDGVRIVNGRLIGNTLTWENLNQGNGCRNYKIEMRLSDDGRVMNGTYYVVDSCAKLTWTGAYENYRKETGISQTQLATSGEARSDGGTKKACGYSVGAVVYDKWQSWGGENFGCPTMNESQASTSPQGTTGRYIQIKSEKYSGGYIIQHGSGRLHGTPFVISGCIFNLYSSMGNTSSWLGFPIADMFRMDPGERQNFEGGYITYDFKTARCNAYKNPSQTDTVADRSVAVAVPPSGDSRGSGSGLTMENNTDRNGQDYQPLELQQASPELCRDACAGDPKCKAYTYVRPNILGPRAFCMLKSGVPPATPNSCCVSGVKDGASSAVNPPMDMRFVGTWRCPCNYSITLNSDGTGVFIDSRGGPPGSLYASGTFHGKWTSSGNSASFTLGPEHKHRAGVFSLTLENGKLRDQYGGVYTR